MPDEQNATGWKLRFREARPIQRPVHPVVRVRFRYTNGSAFGSRVGSGFVISRWPNVVLTAAHVVRLDRDGEQPVRARVTLWSADRSERFVVEAKAMGYPHPWAAERDIALLMLQQSVPAVSPEVETFAAPDGSFEARLDGVVRDLQSRPIVASRSGAFIEYAEGRTTPSMSGGPLYWKQADETKLRVVGVHHRGRLVGDRAPAAGWALDPVWLNACLNAAKAL